METSDSSIENVTGRTRMYLHRLMENLGLCVQLTDSLTDFIHIFLWLQIGLCVFGIAGSAIAAVVCWATKPRTPSCVQLAVLAVYDVFFLLTCLVVAVFSLTDSTGNAAAKVFLVLRSLALWGAAYTTLDICVERFVSIAYPFFAHRRLTVGLACKRSGLILATGVLYIIPYTLDLIYGYSVGEGCIDTGTRELTTFGLVYTLYISLCLLYLLPFVAIISVNVAFAVLLCRLRGRSVRPKGQDSTAEQQLSALVLGLSGWYAVSMLVPCLMFLTRLTRLELFESQTDIRVAAVADAVIVLSVCSNFVFYFLLWRPFRQLVCGWLRVKAGSLHSGSYQTNSHTPQTSSNSDGHTTQVGGTRLVESSLLSARSRGVNPVD